MTSEPRDEFGGPLGTDLGSYENLTQKKKIYKNDGKIFFSEKIKE